MTHSKPATGVRDMLTFDVLKSTALTAGAGCRLGRLSLPGRSAPIDTPHYIGITSRGTIPHLTPDVARQHTQLSGVYTALEDFIERSPAPIFKTPVKTPSSHAPQGQGQEQEPEQLPPSRLRTFIALQPRDALLVLGPRRVPPVATPVSHTNGAISVLTSVGFRQLSLADYIAAARELGPDVVIGFADYYTAEARAGKKRTARMAERTRAWVGEMGAALGKQAAAGGGAGDGVEAGGAQPALFAPVLPLPFKDQAAYIASLADGAVLPRLSGLAFYDTTASNALARLPSPLAHLPRLSLDPSTDATPHDVLAQIAGDGGGGGGGAIDLFALPFLNACTDAGLALDFTFPAPAAPVSASASASAPAPASPSASASDPTTSATPARALAHDLWLPAHATSAGPLAPDCACYACATHNRAYVHHLLLANEMLAWVLLQLHNARVVDGFFAGVRRCLADGTFGRERGAFREAYEGRWPARTGRGPRIRGYQVISTGPGEPKKNAPAFRPRHGGRHDPVPSNGCGGGKSSGHGGHGDGHGRLMSDADADGHSASDSEGLAEEPAAQRAVVVGVAGAAEAVGRELVEAGAGDEGLGADARAGTSADLGDVSADARIDDGVEKLAEGMAAESGAGATGGGMGAASLEAKGMGRAVGGS